MAIYEAKLKQVMGTRQLENFLEGEQRMLQEYVSFVNDLLDVLLVSESLEQVGCHFVIHVAIVEVHNSDFRLSSEIDSFWEAIYLALRDSVVMKDEDSMKDFLHRDC